MGRTVDQSDLEVYHFEAAQDTVQIKWTEKLEAAASLESAGLKQLEKRIDGETGSEYRRLREQFSSILHAWFAQIALLSAKIEPEFLPNPEIVQIFLDTTPRPPLREREAFRILKEAENLTSVLRSNANDELALRSFALSVAIRK